MTSIQSFSRADCLGSCDFDRQDVVSVLGVVGFPPETLGALVADEFPYDLYVPGWLGAWVWILANLMRVCLA